MPDFNVNHDRAAHTVKRYIGLCHIKSIFFLFRYLILLNSLRLYFQLIYYSNSELITIIPLIKYYRLTKYIYIY